MLRSCQLWGQLLAAEATLHQRMMASHVMPIANTTNLVFQEFLAPDLFVNATKTTQWGNNPAGYGVYGEWQLMTDAAQQDAAPGAAGGYQNPVRSNPEPYN